MEESKKTKAMGEKEHERPNRNEERLEVPCCPDLETDEPCDVLDFHYRLIHNKTVIFNDQPRRVSVEVIIHVRHERCTGPLALGDLIHSITLLPGEKVRLFTVDRAHDLLLTAPRISVTAASKHQKSAFICQA